jgi:inactivated superfamily I helicase
MGRSLTAPGQGKSRQRGKARRPLARAIGRSVTAPSAATLYQELCRAVPNGAVLLVFYEWQGILVHSAVLDRSVWVVRSSADGVALTRATGVPSLTLDDVLKVNGRSAEEARVLLSLALIPAPVP